MYQEMQRKVEKDFIACGGGWPDSEDGLCEYVAARWPKLTVDWKAQHEGKGVIDLERAVQGNLTEDEDSDDNEEHVHTVELEQ